MKRAAFALLLLSAAAAAATPEYEAAERLARFDARYCGAPARDARGNLLRSDAVRSAFRAVHPCPATGRTDGLCPGWQLDHVIPLACGGCDAVENMQWLPGVIKSAGRPGKDSWERKVYAASPTPLAGANCTRTLVTPEWLKGTK